MKTRTEFDPLRSLWERIPGCLKACFFTALAAGILTHFYMLANKIPNWDDLSQIIGAGSGKEIGRWGIVYIHGFASHISAPALNGIVTILLHSLAAAISVAAIGTHSVTAAVLIGICSVTFPSLCGNLTFMFTAPEYGVALCLASLAVLWTMRRKWGWIPSAVLLFCSLTLYQTYLTYAAALVLLSMILDLTGAPESTGDTSVRARCSCAAGAFFKGIRGLAMMGAGVAAYLLESRRMPLSDYRGVDTMGQLDIARLPVTVLRAYHRILQYFVTAPPSYVGRHYAAAHLIMLAVAAVVLVFVVAGNRIWREPLRLILLLVCLLLLPLAASAVYVMAPEVQDATTLMIFAYMTVIFLPAVLAERLGEWAGREAGESASRAWTTAARIAVAAAALSVLLVSYHGFRICNEAYFRMGIAFERIENLYGRIMVKVEEQPGYEYGQRLAIVGDSWPEPHALSKYKLDAELFKDFEVTALESQLFTSGSRNDFLRIYLGVSSPDIPREEYDRIHSSPEYQAMPSFPEDGCVQKLGDTWVVKYAE